MTSAAARRMRKKVLALVAVYMAVFLGADFAVHRLHPNGAALLGFAVLPLLPIVGMFALFGRWLGEERDEYKRDMAVRCLVWGTGGFLTVHFLLQFLRIFEWKGELPPFSEFWAFALCMLVAKFSYRAANRPPVEV